ncbi:MAG: hypothetical protein OQK09_09025 [Colwellia sp.]|nr:hypothetical protein [Colwellia sp.]MCW8866029.1 hypothetical protein [Colwellia sp.]MCW9081640.1 hypothetical protein [Colwellia sp.]
MSKNTELNAAFIEGKHAEEQKSAQQQLADAHSEIADLKLQIAWLERSYE